jgi:hypothetical protein
MGAEIAKVSLWLASFVPGLSLAFLDHNLRVGNSLIGVASPEQLFDADGGTSIPAMLVMEQMERAAKATEVLQKLLDRNPEEVARSEEVEAEVEQKVEGARILLDMWIAGPLGVGLEGELTVSAQEVERGEVPIGADRSSRAAREARALHWPLAFPEVFASRGGFDAIVGNPPWEKITIEEHAFYGRYQPGLRALAEGARLKAIEQLKIERPELPKRLEGEQAALERTRVYLATDTSYRGGAGHPDLFEFFCERYERLLAPGGSLAVVLPRSAFLSKGSADFRRWLFGESTVERLDFLLNSGRWAFDAEPRYTVVLLVANASRPTPAHRIDVAGVASSLSRFLAQSSSRGISLDPDALGPELEVPLLPSQTAADLLAQLRRGEPFPLGAGRWRCFPTQELNETFDRQLWQGTIDGWRLWKGESFDQYNPHGAEERFCPASDEALKRASKPNPGAASMLARVYSKKQRATALSAELGHARVAFRDVSRATDSRTVRAVLVPPQVFLTHKAPHLTFIDSPEFARACCLGVMNSLPFDWQARRFVETSVAFFILEGLRVPSLDEDDYASIARSAARLSCPDERFTEFAAATGVEVGPLSVDEHDALRCEIDARVVHAWGLDAADLETIFGDFSLDAVPEAYRQLVRDRLAELAT